MDAGKQTWEFFRAYLTNYLKNLPTVNQDLTCMVRQLQPTETGIPLELYFFSANKAWVAYEGYTGRCFRSCACHYSRIRLACLPKPVGGRPASDRGKDRKLIKR